MSAFYIVEPRHVKETHDAVCCWSRPAHRRWSVSSGGERKIDAGCEHAQKERTPMTTSWTWLVYVASHNNTTDAADSSIEQMTRGLSGGGDKLRVLVQQDAARGC